MVRRRELIPAFEGNPPSLLSVDMLFPEGPSPPKTPPVPVVVGGLKVLGVIPVVVPGVLGVMVPGVLGVVVVGVVGVVLVPAALRKEQKERTTKGERERERQKENGWEGGGGEGLHLSFFPSKGGKEERV